LTTVRSSPSASRLRWSRRERDRNTCLLDPDPGNRDRRHHAGESLGDRRASLGRFGEIKPLHEALSVATIVLVTAHGLLLLGDPWLKPGLTGIVVPFQLAYQPFWTGVGIIDYVRRWIGVARWRVAHRFVAVFWILGLFHTFGAGTDAGQLWLQVPVAVTAIPALVLLGEEDQPTFSQQKNKEFK